jgi:uncharacterized protein (TIRG00374 family)
MGKRAKTWLKQALRWSVAILGIGYVLGNMSWSSHVLVAGPGGWPTARRLASASTDEEAPQFEILENDGTRHIVPRSQLLARVDFARVQARVNGEIENRDLLARRVMDQVDRSRWPYVVSRPRSFWQRYWKIETTDTEFIEPAQIVSGPPTISPYPLIDPGIGSLLGQSKIGLLVAAFFVFPITIFIMPYRWHELLKALEIRLGYAQCFVLNMIGAFYNTFLPGANGGDVFKAIYIAQLTPHRTRAVVSVIADRVIGLLALILLAGGISLIGFLVADHEDPARPVYIRCAVSSLLIIVGTAGGLTAFYIPSLRRYSGLDWLIRRFPMQQRVQRAVETLEMLQRHPGVVLWALVVSLPIHAAVVVAATLVGMAFRLPLHPLYYWIAIPLMALASAIPISPQGAGVIEVCAILLTRRQGCNVSQVFALTTCMRIIGTLWCLLGGLLVIRGGIKQIDER